MATASRDEYLTIGSVIIGTTACWCVNMNVLYNERHRGDDRVLPGTAGVSGNPRILDAVVHSLELIIDGRTDSDGVSNANAHTGLRANIAEIKTITTPVTTGDGTRTVTWTRPGSANVSASCHVGPLEIGDWISKSAVRATLDIQVDAGQFS